MAFMIYAYDHENMDEVREGIREAHRKHLSSAGPMLLASGALLDDDGQTIIGGLSLLDTDSRAEAEKFALDDPYEKAGIRKSTHIVRWRRRWINGQFMAGANT